MAQHWIRDSNGRTRWVDGPNPSVLTDMLSMGSLDVANTWSAQQTFQAPGAGVSPVIVQDQTGAVVGQIYSEGSMLLGGGAGGGFLTLRRDADAVVAPEVHLEGRRGRWIGPAIDVANNGGARDAVPLAKVWPDGSVGDLIYIASNDVDTTTTASVTLPQATIAVASIPAGTPTSGSIYFPLGATQAGGAQKASYTGISGSSFTGCTGGTGTFASGSAVIIGRAPTVGIGVTPPNNTHMLQLSAVDGDPAMGTVHIRVGPTQTGNIITMRNSAGTVRRWMNSDYSWQGDNVGLTIRAANPGNEILGLSNQGGTTLWAFTEWASNMRLRYLTGGASCMEFRTNGDVMTFGAVGFNGTAPVAKPTLPAAAADAATTQALANAIRTALINYGLAA